MQESDFKKVISGLDRIKLSRDEKSIMLSKIYKTPIPSPFYKTGLFMYSGVSIFVALIVFTGTLVSSASSLPGDKLYSIKVKVAEPLVGIARITPESKADWEETKALYRIDEAVTLSDQGKLDEKKVQVLEKSFEKHLESFDNAKANLATTSEGKKEANNKFKDRINEKTKETQKKTGGTTKRENLKKFMKGVEGSMRKR